tara:strand:- start:142786 stop:143331 length:546 start_codon:yes stop_codon:yes gene_type:complete
MKRNIIAKAIFSIALGAIIGFTATTALAGVGHGPKTNIGTPGKASAATRTIEVKMHDNYFEPENISVKEGETVRFIVKNDGEFVHEFNIATGEMHKAHGPEMMMMMEQGVIQADKIDWDAAKKMQASMGHGVHNDPNSVLLEPGKSGEIVWTFPENTKLEFACNVPGHYDSGMVGKINLSH